MHHTDMTLDQYLTETGLTDVAFGKMIGRWPSNVARLKRGVTSPSPQTAEAIFKATNGTVTPTDFMLAAQERRERATE